MEEEVEEDTHARADARTHARTHTKYRKSVTLAAHARRGLIIGHTYSMHICHALKGIF